MVQYDFQYTFDSNSQCSGGHKSFKGGCLAKVLSVTAWCDNGVFEVACAPSNCFDLDSIQSWWCSVAWTEGGGHILSGCAPWSNQTVGAVSSMASSFSDATRVAHTVLNITVVVWHSWLNIRAPLPSTASKFTAQPRRGSK